MRKKISKEKREIISKREIEECVEQSSSMLLNAINIKILADKHLKKFYENVESSLIFAKTPLYSKEIEQIEKYNRLNIINLKYYGKKHI